MLTVSQREDYKHFNDNIRKFSLRVPTILPKYADRIDFLLSP